MISFYIQETSYNKMRRKNCIMGVSMKINNENENIYYISYFIQTF